jgi:preprotein translocase subunit SecG
MGSLLTVLILIICILLILVVLVQNSKGGGLASGFQSSGQMFGVRRTTDFLEKATWGLASALIVLAILASVLGTTGTSSRKESLAKEGAADTDAPAAAPANKPAAPAPTGN